MINSVGRLALSILILANSIIPVQLFAMSGEEELATKETVASQTYKGKEHAHEEQQAAISSQENYDDFFSDEEEENITSATSSCSYHYKLQKKESKKNNEDAMPATESSFLFQEVTLTKADADSIWKCMPKELQELTNDLADKSYEGSLPNLIVLYGPNGTGKSKTAALMAKRARRKLVFINSGFIGTMWKNSEKFNLGEAVNKVVKADVPAVIVIDEADILTSSRSNDEQNDQSLDKTIGELMDSCENNPNIFFVFTTNHPGRLGNKLVDVVGSCFYELGLPTAQARRDILDSYISSFKDMDRDESLDLDYIAGTTNSDSWFIVKIGDFCTRKEWRSMTRGFSIRKLRAFVKEARCIAKKREGKIILRQSDFDQAYKKMKGNLDRYYAMTRPERFYKHIRDNSILYGIGTTVAVSAVGLAINYKFFHLPTLTQGANLADKQMKQAAEIAQEQADLSAMSIVLGPEHPWRDTWNGKVIRTDYKKLLSDLRVCR